MALGYKSRRRWSLLILVVGLPLYIMAAVSVVGWFSGDGERLPILAELAVYLALGFLWALPFRFVFRGIGKADPEDDRPQE